MKAYRLIYGLLSLSGLLAGCATLSQEECRRGDWYGIGRRDAYQGYPDSRLDEHRKACAEYRVIPDAAAYAQGYRAGLQDFCTPARGFQYGRQGGYYQNNCPPALEPGFLNQYRLGRELNSLESQLSNIDSEIIRLEDRLRHTDDKDKRRRLRNELYYLYDRKNGLRQQWYYLENSATLQNPCPPL